MGDPKRRRKTYTTPPILWNKERMEEERKLLQEYGLKNKKELWKMNSLLSSFAQQAKKLIAATTPQSELEKKQLLTRLSSLGLIPSATNIDDALALDIRKILERRLQTLVFKKGLARTPKQARQFITHGHIAIGNKKITVPSYLVPKSEEDQISFIYASPLTSLEHPERIQKKQKVKEEKSVKEEKKEPKEKKEAKSQKSKTSTKEEKTEKKEEQEKKKSKEK